MYEIHGWIKLAEAASEIDEGGFNAKCDKLQGFIREISWPSGVLELAVMNGVHVLIIHAAPNRRRSEADELDRCLNSSFGNSRVRMALNMSTMSKQRRLKDVASFPSKS